MDLSRGWWHLLTLGPQPISVFFMLKVWLPCTNSWVFSNPATASHWLLCTCRNLSLELPSLGTSSNHRDNWALKCISQSHISLNRKFWTCMNQRTSSAPWSSPSSGIFHPGHYKTLKKLSVEAAPTGIENKDSRRIPERIKHWKAILIDSWLILNNSFFFFFSIVSI